MERDFQQIFQSQGLVNAPDSLRIRVKQGIRRKQQKRIGAVLFSLAAVLLLAVLIPIQMSPAEPTPEQVASVESYLLDLFAPLETVQSDSSGADYETIYLANVLDIELEPLNADTF